METVSVLFWGKKTDQKRVRKDDFAPTTGPRINLLLIFWTVDSRNEEEQRGKKKEIKVRESVGLHLRNFFCYSFPLLFLLPLLFRADPIFMFFAVNKTHSGFAEEGRSVQRKCAFPSHFLSLTPVVSRHISPLEDALLASHALGQLVVGLEHSRARTGIVPEKKEREREPAWYTFPQVLLCDLCSILIYFAKSRRGFQSTLVRVGTQKWVAKAFWARGLKMVTK